MEIQPASPPTPWSVPFAGVLVDAPEGSQRASYRGSPAACRLAQSLTGGWEVLEGLILDSLQVARPSAEEEQACRLKTEGRDGSPVHLLSLTSRVEDSWWIRFVDDTQGQVNQGSQRKQEALLERLVETMPVALFIKDPRNGFRFTRLNACFEETFGVCRSEFLGLCDADIFEPELAQSYHIADLAVFDSKQATIIDESIQTARGLRAARTIKVPLFDAEGQPELLLGILQDVEDLQALVRTAEEANATKSRFLANASHELRTPLYGILGMLQEARTSVEPEARASALGLAEESARTLMSVMSDLFDFNQLQSGDAEIDPTPISFEDVVETALHGLATLAREQAVQVVFAAPSPQITPRQEVLADPRCLTKIITNLVSNAIKYSPQGESVRVRIQCSSHDLEGKHYGRYRVEVADRGPGIPQELQDRIFQPFQHSRYQTMRPQERTGLGLAIVQQLVDWTGGTVQLSSEVGQGSTFSVEWVLPVVKAAGAPEAPAPAPGAPCPPANILMAEDNVINQRIATRILENVGHTVTVTADGQAALDELFHGTQSFDFVLLDIQMPRMDGLTALAAIREAEVAGQALHPCRRIPIVILTANAGDDLNVRCLKAGADGFLSKPLGPGDLLNELALHDRRSGRESNPSAA